MGSLAGTRCLAYILCTLLVVVALVVLVPVIALGVGTLIAIGLLYLLYFCAQSFGDAEVRSADECAQVLTLKVKEARIKDQTSDKPKLPEKLQGVFWMADNAAPEMLM